MGSNHTKISRSTESLIDNNFQQVNQRNLEKLAANTIFRIDNRSSHVDVNGTIQKKVENEGRKKEKQVFDASFTQDSIKSNTLGSN